MKSINTFSLILIIILLPFTSCENSTSSQGSNLNGSLIIADHNSTDINSIPSQWIDSAKNNLQIAYGHTSHGSQIVTGMNALVDVYGDKYRFNGNGSNGALRFRDTPFSNASDLGNPDLTAWASATDTYLGNHPETNVIMWSWCGQVSSADSEDIATYLELMTSLEEKYPSVRFIYMTGHLDGSGPDGNLHTRNQQIRNYCIENKKLLFDFADIESYDPEGIVNFMAMNANDNCDYEYNGASQNWVEQWLLANPTSELTQEASVVCNSCCAHSQGLNCVRKARAFWWMLARISGWSGV